MPPAAVDAMRWAAADSRLPDGAAAAAEAAATQRMASTGTAGGTEALIPPSGSRAR